MGNVYALIAYHHGVNENYEIGLDFFIVRIGDGRIWPHDQHHDYISPIALYSRRTTAVRDSTQQVGEYLAGLVKRGGKLHRPVVPTVPVITPENLNEMVAETLARQAEYSKAIQAYHAERGAEIQAEKRAKREASKAAKSRKSRDT